MFIPDIRVNVQIANAQIAAEVKNRFSQEFEANEKLI
jgi:hypothetical protein